MKLPVDEDSLPEALADVVQTAVDEDDFGDAIEAIEDWMDETGQRPPEVLAVLAAFLLQDALEVMVDEIAETGALARSLLDEAGLDTAATRALRRAIESAIKRSNDYDRDKERAARALVKATPLDDMTERQLRDVAYVFGLGSDAADKRISADAYDRASKSSTEPATRKDCEGRAALEYGELDWTLGEPRLRRIIDNAGDYESWIVGMARYQFLDRAMAAGDAAAFSTMFAAGIAASPEFPVAMPKQDEYLAFAVEHRLASIAKHLAAQIDQRSARLKKPVASLLARAKQLA